MAVLGGRDGGAGADRNHGTQPGAVSGRVTPLRGVGLGALFILIAALAVYLRAPSNQGLPEDDAAIWSNPAVTAKSPGAALLGRFYDDRRDGFRAAIRPAAVVLHRIEFGLFARRGPAADSPPAASPVPPDPSRAPLARVRVFLLAVSGLVFFLAWRQTWAPAVALAAALAFVVHPLGAAAVLPLAGSGELLALVFSGLAIWSVECALRGVGRDRRSVVLSGLFVLLAGLSHELGYVVLPVLAVRLWAQLRAQKQTDGRAVSEMRRYPAVPAIAIGGGLALGHRLLSLALLPEHLRIGPAVDTAAGLGLVQRFYYGLAGCGEFVRSFLLPFRLSYVNDFILSSGLTPMRAVAGLALLAVLGAWLVRSVRAGERNAIWIGWTFFSLVGATGLVLPTPDVASPRLFFFVVPGAISLIVLGVRAALKKGELAGKALQIGLGAVGGWVLLLLGLRTADRVRDYRDWETVVRRQTEEFPRSAQSWFDLGNLRFSRGNLVAAIAAYEKATELRPGYWAAWINLGAAFANQEERGLALRAYERVLAGVQGREEFRVIEARAHYHRSLILLTQNRNVEAAQGFEKMLEVFPDHLYSHANLGFLYSNSRSLYEKASAHLNRAMDLETDPARRETLTEYLNGIRVRQARLSDVPDGSGQGGATGQSGEDPGDAFDDEPPEDSSDHEGDAGR